jgi:anaerobic selenocysteine-containing dehydrogenase
VAATEVRRSVCPRDCPDVCSMIAHVENGKIVRVVGDPDHPITRGYLCGRFQHYEELIHHEDRLLYPLAREHKSDDFERVSWDEALDLIASRFLRIVDEHGPEAILPYRYLGNMGVLGTNYADRLWNRIGTSRVGMEICAIAGIEAVLRVFGRLRGTEPQFVSRTKLFLAWGKNPKETNIHGWVNDFRDVHPLIVIDPFESDTAAAADIFVKLKPATDSMLAMGMMRILIENDWIDREFIEQRTLGFEALRDKVMQVSLDDVERVTGVPRAQIDEVTRLYAEHRPGLIQVGQGLQRNLNGGEIVANICMLAAIAGQVGVPGGGIFYSNYEWNHNDIGHPEFRTGGTKLYNMIKLGRWLTETDEIQGLYVYNSNPVVTCPNQNLVKEGIGREDLFVVVHDLFLTDTARLANVVLPASSFAEQTDLHYSYWHDYVQINNQVIPPIGESRSNFWVFNQIAKRMGYPEPCFDQTEEEVIEEALAGTGLDIEELKRGPVFVGDMERTSFDDGRFGTRSGKIELIEPTYSPHDDERHAYRLLTPKTKHLHSSQGYILPSVARKLREADFFVHPDDAELEGIADGELVRLWNDRGDVWLVARVSERTQPNVLVSYNGRWGDNVNATTSDEEADLGGQSIFQSNWVSLERQSRGVAR